jgi:type II secretory pathway component PulK
MNQGARMNRRGFAMLATLWLLAALTALVGVALATSRVGWMTTRNRVLLARAEWAREACVEILLARYAQRASAQSVDTVDLGRGTWCRASLEDPAARIDVNTADRPTLERLLSVVSPHASVIDSILAIRRRGRIYDLAQIPGVDSTALAGLRPLLTTRGSGVVNVNAASRKVLATLPGMSEEGIALVLARRELGRPVRSADDLGAQLSRVGRATLYANYQDFVLRAVVAPPRLVATIEGGVMGTPLVARATLTLVPVPGRLAVIRRETE